MTLSDSLNRAHAAGLISGTARDIGNKVNDLYWCSSNSDKDEHELYDILDAVREKGRCIYRAFTQLVIDINMDHGPKWLDRIIEGHPIATDPETLDLAIDGLSAMMIRENGPQSEVSCWRSEPVTVKATADQSGQNVGRA